MSARAPRPPMGIATKTTVQNKILYRDFLASFDTGDFADVAQLQSSLEALNLRLTDDLYSRIAALSVQPAPATDRLEEAVF